MKIKLLRANAPVPRKASPAEFARHPYSYSVNPPTFQFVCKRVQDGDTMEGWTYFSRRKYEWEIIRLRGIDCPEIFSPRNAAELAHGNEAKALTESIVTVYPTITRAARDAQTYSRVEADVLYWKDKMWQSLADALRAAGMVKRDTY